MSKKIKVIILLGVVATMCLGVFVGCGNGKILTGENFSLTIEVNGAIVSADDVIEASVGDIIEVRATLKNLSGRNVRIESMPRSGAWGIITGDIIHLYIMPRLDSYPAFSGGPPVSSVRARLRQNESLTQTLEYQIDAEPIFGHYPIDGEYTISASAVFYVNRSRTEPITLSVRLKITTN